MELTKEEQLEKTKEELINFLREETTNEEFLNFAFAWLGEEFIMDLVEDGINGCEALEDLKQDIIALKKGEYAEHE